ncbi:MAG: hypothetical protein GY765_06550, partial [bacterium]|nr:hypothetical protein [bacterium]
MENILMELKNLMYGAAYAMIVFVFMYIAKIMEDIRTTKIDDDNQIEEHSNLALGFRRFGLYLAVALAMMGQLLGPSKGFKDDVVSIAIEGAFIILCLFAVRFITDLVILSGIDNDAEILKKNNAVGLGEMA